MTVLNNIEEELLLLKKSVHSFAEEHIEPFYDEWEEAGIIPREFWDKLGDAGFLCVDIPEKYGGLSAPLSYALMITEEFSRLGYGSVAANIAVHSNIIAHYILNHGTEEQKNHYLPKMATGELIGAVAMTEPGTGSDLQGVQTTAIQDDENDMYIINGSKTFITNGQHFDFIITVTRTNKGVRASQGISLLIVDADIPGVMKGKNLQKIGLHAADTSELFLDNVAVSSNKILGNLNEGFNVLMTELPRERFMISVLACSSMEGALDITLQYLKEREAFGKHLKDIQVIRHKVADMVTEVKVNRAYLNHCLRLLEENKLSTADASISKLSASEAQGRVVDECLQLFGGYGYMKEYPISRFYTDARVQRIYGGTSEIMKEIISKSVLN